MTMDFTGGSILLTIFGGIIAGLASYFTSYTKVKAELRAATEDLRTTMENLRRTTRVVEGMKVRIAARAQS